MTDGDGAARRKRAADMAKPSYLLRKIDAQKQLVHEIALSREVDRVTQMVQDAAFFAAADVFQMGPGRCEAFGAALRKYVNEMARMMCMDKEGDPECVYTKEKVDQRMKRICGDKFAPWEVRYGEDKEK